MIAVLELTSADNANSEFFCSILVYFKFQKLWSHNMKVQAKDLKVNIAVT
jgi:hypothetical protein